LSGVSIATGYENDSLYRIAGVQHVMTPALAIYPDIVQFNIDATLRLLEGDADRWRPHLKTVKLASVMKMLVDFSIFNFKCATSLELLTVCAAGAKDVAIAYPLIGANALRVVQIADEHRQVRISALAEAPEHVGVWTGSRVGLFIDINPGMNRTGLEQNKSDEILALADLIIRSGIEFRGIHYYDGQYAKTLSEERMARAHTGYDRLLEIIGDLKRANIQVEEVITSGTPSFPCALSYSKFRDGSFRHRVSPGTVVYGDVTSNGQLPVEYGYKAAAVVVSRVVSHPGPDLITCDAGHKAVAADMGPPTCVVAGRTDLIPLSPSEEHLPIRVPSGAALPALGDILYLVPRHVCPTVNNFNDALIVRDGRVERIESVTARGREVPMVAASSGRRS
jgi:D-serine deaminase-like pyridoxal phosphate-dependent protein